MATTNYIPKVSLDKCVSCGKCAKVCQILEIAMEEKESADTAKKKQPAIDEEICLGCGVRDDIKAALAETGVGKQFKSVYLDRLLSMYQKKTK